MTKFGIVFLVVLAGAAIWGLTGRGIADRASADPGVAGNERLTALTGAILYVLLVGIVLTVLDISGLLLEHYLVGLLMIPPVILKFGSTGYRFFRYYQRSQPYRLAGAPPILLRFVVAPILVVSTGVVFVTGVELWLFGLRFGPDWMPVHTLSAVIMLLAAAAHLLARLPRSAQVLGDDVVRRPSGAQAGRSLVVASLLLGAVLAATSLFYSSPFPASAAGG
jgi:hypothetical protein